MGNTQTTSLAYRHAFATPERLRDSTLSKSITFRIVLDPPAQAKDGMTLPAVYLRLTPTNAEFIRNPSTPFDYECKFDSHMRDFEVCPGAQTPRIARGQGIGVLVVERTQTYAKLCYDKTAPHGIAMGNYQAWHGGETYLDGLEPDLGLGYHVILIDLAGKMHSFVEPRDKRDASETLILFKHLAPLARYEHGETDKSTSEADEPVGESPPQDLKSSDDEAKSEDEPKAGDETCSDDERENNDEPAKKRARRQLPDYEDSEKKVVVEKIYADVLVKEPETAAAAKSTEV